MLTLLVPLLLSGAPATPVVELGPGGRCALATPTGTWRWIVDRELDSGSPSQPLLVAGELEVSRITVLSYDAGHDRWSRETLLLWVHEGGPGTKTLASCAPRSDLHPPTLSEPSLESLDFAESDLLAHFSGEQCLIDVGPIAKIAVSGGSADVRPEGQLVRVLEEDAGLSNFIAFAPDGKRHDFTVVTVPRPATRASPRTAGPCAVLPATK